TAAGSANVVMNASRPLNSGRGRHTGTAGLTSIPKWGRVLTPVNAPSHRAGGRGAGFTCGANGRTSVSAAVITSRLRLQRLNATYPLLVRNGQRSLLRLAVAGVFRPSGWRTQRVVDRRAWSRPRSGVLLEAKMMRPWPRSAGST